MGWILHAFSCTCGTEWEELVDREDPKDTCKACNTECKPCISTPGLATFSIMSPEDQAKHLRKRSRDHTKREIKKDPSVIRTGLKPKGKR
jgi:hypothetical protein